MELRATIRDYRFSTTNDSHLKEKKKNAVCQSRPKQTHFFVRENWVENDSPSLCASEWERMSVQRPVGKTSPARRERGNHLRFHPGRPLQQRKLIIDPMWSLNYPICNNNICNLLPVMLLYLDVARLSIEHTRNRSDSIDCSGEIKHLQVSGSKFNYWPSSGQTKDAFVAANCY